jgi:hypothetical protein
VLLLIPAVVAAAPEVGEDVDEAAEEEEVPVKT